MPKPWENGAAWPTAMQLSAQHGTSAMDVRTQQQQKVIRTRVLTLAGNACNAPVAITSTTLTVTFARPEFDAHYGVTATPSWNTTLWVTAQTVTGFVLNFGTAAPAAETVSWHTFRSES